MRKWYNWMCKYFEEIIERYSKYNLDTGRVVGDVINCWFGR